jgi:hypothetical protein
MQEQLTRDGRRTRALAVAVRTALVRAALVRAVLALAALALLAPGCGTEGSTGTNSPGACVATAGGASDNSANLALTDDKGTAKLTYDVYAGAKTDLAFSVANTASAITALPLRLKSVKLVEIDGNGKPASAPQFTCLLADGSVCKDGAWPAVVPVGYKGACAESAVTEAQKFVIRFNGAKSNVPHKLSVTLAFDGDAKHPTASFTVQAHSGTPKLACDPATIDFGQVSLGDTATATVTCTNPGTDTVHISEASIQVIDKSVPITIDFEGKAITPTAPLTGEVAALEPGNSVLFGVKLGPLTSTNGVKLALQLTSDAPQKETSVLLSINVSGQCLKVNEGIAIDFGSVAVGQPATKPVDLKNCGSEDVLLTNVALSADSAPGFTVSFDSACFGKKVPSAAEPKVIEPGQACAFLVGYAPTQQEPPVKASVLLTTAAGGSYSLGLKGASTQAQCPTACAKVTAKKPDGTLIGDGEAVIPQSMLLFDANCSIGAAPHFAKDFKFTLTQQPPGSFATFKPTNKPLKASATAPVGVVALAVNSAGTYKIQLDVADETGTPACAPWEKVVTVVPDDYLHAELSWDTPGDPSKTDDKGADMDLHVAHEDALTAAQFAKPPTYQNWSEDPFFNTCYDCYTLTCTVPLGAPASNLTWGDLTNYTDDPRFDLDDQDGWGPENINMNKPEVGTTYHVGAYYQYDAGFGASTPHLKLYVDKQLIFDKNGPSMKSGKGLNDFWCATKLTYGKNTLTPCKGADNNGDLLIKGYKAWFGGGKFGCQ